jgi:hypothetical protein
MVVQRRIARLSDADNQIDGVGQTETRRSPVRPNWQNTTQRTDPVIHVTVFVSYRYIVRSPLFKNTIVIVVE